MSTPTPTIEEVESATRRWLERAVIGLDLCPFARQPVRQDRLRLRVSEAGDVDTLIAHLGEELEHLHASTPDACETILLVLPRMFPTTDDFADFNDFLGAAEEALENLDLDGEIQLASFHPGYCFADVTADDPSNLTNRSPYPILHLLREASLARAIDAYGDTDRIWQRNMERMRTLGHAGWAALWEDKGIDPGNESGD
jgi:uncharacterized protein